MTVLGASPAVVAQEPEAPIPVPFFIRGAVVTGYSVKHRSRDLGVDFATPAIDLDALIGSRSELPPLLDVPIKEIIDFLVECGTKMEIESNPHLQEALEHTCKVNPLPRRVIENLFRGAQKFLTRE